jgi:transcriptional regulator with XRE-family HTH domain
MHHVRQYTALLKMSADPDQIAGQIAARVRAGRAQRRWTLDELAARSGVSRRLIVQIEQGDANPSLATLLKLAAALDVTLTELLAGRPQDRPVAVVPRQDAMTLWSTPAGGAAHLLVSHGPLELWAWTLQPGDRRASQPHRPGALELLTVQTGTIRLEVGDHHVEVSAGDSAWFDATHPHAYDNPGATAANFTLVVLDPA